MDHCKQGLSNQEIKLQLLQNHALLEESCMEDMAEESIFFFSVPEVETLRCGVSNKEVVTKH